MKTAIQGEPGSFSHEAALKLVADAEIVPCALSAEVFAALAGGGYKMPVWAASRCKNRSRARSSRASV